MPCNSIQSLLQQQNVKISQCGFVLNLGFIAETSNWANWNHQCASNTWCCSTALQAHLIRGSPKLVPATTLTLLLGSDREGATTKSTLTLHQSISFEPWHKPRFKDPKEGVESHKAQTTQVCAQRDTKQGHTPTAAPSTTTVAILSIQKLLGVYLNKSQCHIPGHWSLSTRPGLTSWHPLWGLQVIVCLGLVFLHVNTSWDADFSCCKMENLACPWDHWLLCIFIHATLLCWASAVASRRRYIPQKFGLTSLRKKKTPKNTQGGREERKKKNQHHADAEAQTHPLLPFLWEVTVPTAQMAAPGPGLQHWPVERLPAAGIFKQAVQIQFLFPGVVYYHRTSEPRQGIALRPTQILFSQVNLSRAERQQPSCSITAFTWEQV